MKVIMWLLMIVDMRKISVWYTYCICQHLLP